MRIIFVTYRRILKKENYFMIGVETNVILALKSSILPIQIQNNSGCRETIQLLKESRLLYMLSFQSRIPSFSSFLYFHMVNFFLSCCFYLDITSSRQILSQSIPHHFPPFYHPSCLEGRSESKTRVSILSVGPVKSQ